MTQAIWFGDKTRNKDQVKLDIEAAHFAFERLSKILKDKIKDNSATDYEMASWPFLQADNNGYNRALKEVLKLIK